MLRCHWNVTGPARSRIPEKQLVGAEVLYYDWATLAAGDIDGPCAGGGEHPRTGWREAGETSAAAQPGLGTHCVQQATGY